MSGDPAAGGAPAAAPPVLGRGHPWPLGAQVRADGLNLALHSRSATVVTLLVFADAVSPPLLETRLDPARHRTGDTWHAFLPGAGAGTVYAFRIERAAPSHPRRPIPDPRTVIPDPYARALAAPQPFGAPPPRPDPPGRRALVAGAGEGAAAALMRRPAAARPPVDGGERIIYELHVRSFTRHPSAAVAAPGTFLGLAEKIPHLLALGVTTVELMPVQEFDEHEIRRKNPLTGARLRNLWGYSPIVFSAVKAGYAATGAAGGQVAELKALVRELHQAGLEVVLDVVFNHTAEKKGRRKDPVYGFRALDEERYYLIDHATGRYRDLTGCGNTVRANDPFAQHLVLDALRWFRTEIGVDGFRFDLAAILARGPEGEAMDRPPLIARIEEDSVLADALLIAEPWDAAGLFLLGAFPGGARWAEWNSAFRDDVRRFVRGDPGFAGRFAARLAGSPDLFQAGGRGPHRSVNYVACHDGFTLADLVSYARKRNLANGERNRDGPADDFSSDGGIDGPTGDPEVLALRARRVRTLLTVLFLSEGTPMLLMGDEMGRSQRGNNNAYCQDDETSWLDWSLAAAHADLLRFTRALIALRKRRSAFRRTTFPAAPEVDRFRRWHGVRPFEPDLGPTSRALAMQLRGAPEGEGDLYLAINAGEEPLAFAPPPPPEGARWRLAVDTAAPPPRDVAAEGDERPLEDPGRLLVAPSSCIVLVSRP